MSTTKFVFDLDGTITRLETLPLIARHFGIEDAISELTQSTIRGNVPFIESFIKRVGILGQFSFREIDALLAEVPVFEGVMQFISNHVEDCVIATGNLDVWTHSILQKIGCKHHCSRAKTTGHKVDGIETILRKADIVAELQSQGHTVVYIGEGNNDSEAMRLADHSIASGLVHEPANSVMAIADFATYSEDALVRLLNAMAQPERESGQTVVISCAGVGSRLGLGSTKALITLADKPLIQWQLDHFADIEDVRIVLGFQALDVIETTSKIRPDVIFALNHDYFSTGTGKSLYLGSRFSRSIVIAWDGDLVVHRDDIDACLKGDDEYLGISETVSEDTVFVELDAKHNNVTGFTRTSRHPYEWSGPARLLADRIRDENGHVYSGLIDQLPLPAKKIRAFDIDTPADYQYALNVFGEYEHDE